MSPTPFPLAGDGVPWLSVDAVDGSRAAANWDALVAGFPEAGPFHGSPWMRVLEASYGFRSVGLILRRGPRVVGLIPMVEVSSRFTGRRGVALPFADECPPLAAPDVPVGALLQPLATFARGRGWDFFELRGQHLALGPIIAEVPEFRGRTPPEGLPGQVPSVSFHGHRLHLPATSEALWKGLKGPVRTAVRKAESAGVTIEFSSALDALREFHGLYRLTRQRHGLPPQPFSFFGAIQKEILAREPKAGDSRPSVDLGGMVVLARWKGRAVAGAVFFHRGDRAIYKYGAFDHRCQELRANNLVFWAALRRYVEQGIRTVDLGRTSLGNEGLRRFKLGWGGVEYPIDYTKYDLHQKAFVKEKDMAAGWYNWAFRVSPRWLSSFAGQVLYKHWA